MLINWTRYFMVIFHLADVKTFNLMNSILLGFFSLLRSFCLFRFGIRNIVLRFAYFFMWRTDGIFIFNYVFVQFVGKIRCINH